jgi:hypothetical protein
MFIIKFVWFYKNNRKVFFRIPMEVSKEHKIAVAPCFHMGIPTSQYNLGKCFLFGNVYVCLYISDLIKYLLKQKQKVCM